MDKILKLGDSIIQSGNFSNRIYLMKLKGKDMPEIMPRLDKIALDNNYSKIIAKVPERFAFEFSNNGYTKEGFIPNFFKDNSDCHFMSKYLDAKRKIKSNNKEINNVIEVAKLNKNKKNYSKIDYDIRMLEPNEAKYASELYKKVFTTYPFPIFDSEYIEKTMNENIIYCGVWDESNLIGIASSEMDFDNQNSEMTDFAVLNEYRGQNIALQLLKQLENLTLKKGIKTLYTIARAVSYGMNNTFAKNNYTYSGTLVNNTNIAGGIESMNIWYKIIE